MSGAKEYAVLPGAPTVTTTGALRVMRDLVALAEQQGFMLALYGSTVRHFPDSRPCSDVNLFAVPGRPVTMIDAMALLRAIYGVGYSLFEPIATNASPFPDVRHLHVRLREAATGIIICLNIRELE